MVLRLSAMLNLPYHKSGYLRLDCSRECCSGAMGRLYQPGDSPFQAVSPVGFLTAIHFRFSLADADLAFGDDDGFPFRVYAELGSNPFFTIRYGR